MTIQGPFIDGSFSRNNAFSASVSPNAATPTGALLWLIVGSNVVDTANVIITDTVGNIWELQAFNQLPGTSATILIAIARNAQALTTSDSITLTSDIRGNWDGCLYHHIGAVGEIFSRDLEYFDTGVNPHATCHGLIGQTLFATIAVAGPRTDGFTQDVNWSADQKTTLTGNVTVHACGRTIPLEGDYTYAPTLGTSRKSFVLALSFN